MAHLVADVSGHGFGHAAMTLPVLERLHARRPDVRLTIRSALDAAWLGERLDAPFTPVPEPHEFGMKMVDSVRVLAEESLDAYAALHAGWEPLMEREASALRRLAPDLVLSNVSYIALAAAGRAGVRSVAYSSLNWADVFMAYCAHLPGAAAVHRVMQEAYAEAEVFLRPAPSMAMPSIANALDVGPVARLGVRDPGRLRQAAGVAPGDRVLLVSMGGIPTPIDYMAWPRLPGWKVVLGSGEHPDHPDLSNWRETGMSFIDILASSDAILVKPGYGLFVEGVCNGRPVATIPRPGWPETEPELAWLRRHGRGRLIEESELRAGRFTAALEALLAAPPVPPPPPSGVDEVVDQLLARLPPP